MTGFHRGWNVSALHLGSTFFLCGLQLNFINHSVIILGCLFLIHELSHTIPNLLWILRNQSAIQLCHRIPVARDDCKNDAVFCDWQL